MKKTLLAAVQMASGPKVRANLIEAGRLIERAAAEGSSLVVLPENFAIMGLEETDKLAVGEAIGSGPIQDFLAEAAAKSRLWLVGGTLPIQAGNGKVRSTCLIYDDHGHLAGRYDKIHLFDVNVPGTQERYRESATIEAGTDPLVLDTPFGRVGVAICYDVRFPELFRHMLAGGVDILVIPSAFTAQTGAAHWELLIRTRSVENLCYTVAANQGGFHINGRETYGHSMIVDPWGQILASQPQGSGVVTAEFDPDRLDKVRMAFPALEHCQLIPGR